ncbi:MAG: translation initiation factor IF-2 [Planctomycetota bacterium]
MARRVFEIAKELGVASKAVVTKCHAEGIPDDVVKNHMSSISVGLEATIKEWFSEGSAEGGHATATAVETSEKVDITKVKAKPRAKAKAKAKPKAEPATDAPATEAPAAQPQVETEAKPEPPAPAAPTTPAAPPPATKVAPAASDPAPAPEAGPEQPAAPEPQAEPIKPAAEAPKPKPVAPPTMNVPTRPKVVAPAGPRIEEIERKKVSLSGPKVVRVEAPETLDVPRRGPRTGGGGPGGPGGPGGDPFGPPGMGGRDRGGDRNRRGGPSSRRNTRGGGGGGAQPFRQQDLIEREARLQRSGGFMKRRRQDAKRKAGASADRAQTPAQTGGTVKIQAPFTIKDLSAATGVKAADIVKQLFMQGVMATINSGIDVEQAQEIMMEYEIELEVEAAASAEDAVAKDFEDRENVDERPRGPVVTIMGHVDHGKTSLLDKIRNANVAAGEAGGITQATSAFQVPVTIGGKEKFISFVDTPGHEAFTAMRSRGANVTDIVVLVVAADDGVMPQTIESINHCKAAGVPLVVALNKIDKPEATDANIQKILGQLAEHELNPVEWGGDTEVVKTSAAKGEGIDELLEILDLQAEVLELTADFDGPARGTVVESRHETGRGSVANVLLQDGKLAVGDFIVAGPAFGRVRDITDDRGKKLKEAYPPRPVQISGIDELPLAGDKFFCVDTLKKAQQAAEQRRERDRETQLAQPKVTLDTLFSTMESADVKEILVVIKADVQGSVDVLKHEIEKVSTDEVKVRALHAAVGGITESDVILAEASKAIIIGFNVIPSGKARRQADDKGVEIRTYDVIYHITEDITKAAEGMLEPELRQEVLGHAEVRQVFKVSKVGAIAGCYVTDGVVERDALIRVTRNDIVIENDRKLEQLKRFKDDAKEVRANMECGMKIHGYDDIKEGDILECYKQIEIKRTL